MCRKPIYFCTTQSYDVVAEWTTMKFEWSSAEEEEEALESGYYIPENCFMTGIKVRGIPKMQKIYI